MISVAVVDADSPGNVGTIARAMKNFGFDDLVLVDPPALDRDGPAYGMAGQAREDILPEARAMTFEALVGAFHTVGFTAITNEDDSKHVRFPFSTPAELAESLPREGPVALVFGRERVGLSNAELAQLDEICSIPATATYPVLNLGQAATIALYELRDIGDGDTQHPNVEQAYASPAELEAFYAFFDELLGQVEYPDEKRDKTNRLMRRLLGRAQPTGRELMTLRGVLRRAAYRPSEDPQTQHQ